MKNIYLFGGRGSCKTTLQAKLMKETIKCLKAMIEYEENCELKYDRFIKNSLPIPKGERLIDYAVKHKVDDFVECEKLYKRYELSEAKLIVERYEKGDKDE